jgi:hypothetical protein
MLQRQADQNPHEKLRIDSLRYITIFEIKNFEEIIIKSCKEAFSIILEIEETVKSVLKSKIKYKFEEEYLHQSITVKVEHNKIVMFSRGNTNLDLIAILKAAAKVMSQLLSKHILLAGHVAYGHFYFSDDQKKFCGKPYVMAYQQAKEIQCCAITCDTLVQQNIQEAKIFINDPDFFSKMGKSLLEKHDIPIFGTRINGEIVSKKMFTVDWPRAEIDVFGTIKEYKIEEFFKPYKAVYGEYEQLDVIKRTYFEETLKLLNNSLAQCIKLFNSTI